MKHILIVGILIICVTISGCGSDQPKPRESREQPKVQTESEQEAKKRIIEEEKLRTRVRMREECLDQCRRQHPPFGLTEPAYQSCIRACNSRYNPDAPSPAPSPARTTTRKAPFFVLCEKPLPQSIGPFKLGMSISELLQHVQPGSVNLEHSSRQAFSDDTSRASDKKLERLHEMVKKVGSKAYEMKYEPEHSECEKWATQSSRIHCYEYEREIGRLQTFFVERDGKIRFFRESLLFGVTPLLMETTDHFMLVYIDIEVNSERSNYDPRVRGFVGEFNQYVRHGDCKFVFADDQLIFIWIPFKRDFNQKLVTTFDERFGRWRIELAHRDYLLCDGKRGLMFSTDTYPDVILFDVERTREIAKYEEHSLKESATRKVKDDLQRDKKDWERAREMVK
jgi:hypothetical protein